MSAEVQLAIVEFEIFLGIWLLTGAAAVGAWLTALTTFTIFAGISFYLGVIGQTSCGCFGRFPPSPWWAFALDAVVIGLLLLGRPDFAGLRDERGGRLTRTMLPTLYAILGVFAISISLYAIAFAGYGSIPAAIAHLRGERISVQPRLADVGTGTLGDQREAEIDVTNWTEHPIRLIGGTADCSCTVLGDLPLTIPPNETRTVKVDVAMTGKPGIFTRKAAFLVDDEGFKAVTFRLTGRIVSADQ
ncbi:MAG: DUF1573 domain-containing protein [Planctomycetes bacterium]|nr:DUF1573 domain-containing protein [Planctomycetota bacterium]